MNRQSVMRLFASFSRLVAAFTLGAVTASTVFSVWLIPTVRNACLNPGSASSIALPGTSGAPGDIAGNFAELLKQVQANLAARAEQERQLRELDP